MKYLLIIAFNLLLENYKNKWVMTTDYMDGFQLYLMYFDVDKLELLFTNDKSDNEVNQLRDEEITYANFSCSELV